MCYVHQSCCLITGEKNLNEGPFYAPRDTFPSPSDPSIPASHKF